MLSKSIEEKIKRRVELVAKRVSVGLTLTEAWELGILDADLNFQVDITMRSGEGDIEEE